MNDNLYPCSGCACKVTHQYDCLLYTGEALDAIIEEALGLQQDPEGGGKGILASIGSTISSLQRFSRSLSR